jgi:hypothetical protein
MWNLKTALPGMDASGFYALAGGGLVNWRYALPSALAGLLTCLSLFFFFVKELSMPWAVSWLPWFWLQPRVLFTSMPHAQGDYDHAIDRFLAHTLIIGVFSLLLKQERNRIYTLSGSRWEWVF